MIRTSRFHSKRLARTTIAFATALIVANCSRPSRSSDSPPSNLPASLSSTARLPTGARLDPAGRSTPLGNMPLSALLAPDGHIIVVSLSGYREQGLQIVNRETGALVQRLPQSGAFVGLAFSADGSTLYASGGATDRVYVYSWRASSTTPATLIDSITMVSATTAPNDSAPPPGSRYVAGLALSHDGRMLYVAENLADSIAVVDLASHRIVQRLGAGSYPYAVVTAADGRVYVSDWGAGSVDVYHTLADGRLAAERPIDVGRHPSALALSANGSRLFAASASTDRVAVVDTRSRRVIRWLLDPPPDDLAEGSTPDALALSADGTRLFVAEADVNAVAVFELSALTSGIATAHGDDSLAGRIPTEWYPTAVLAPNSAHSADSLLVINGKGRGAGPNPTGPRPDQKRADEDPRGYTLGQLDGTLTVVPAARGEALGMLSHRVAESNGWTAPRTHFKYPPVEHVIYIIKENRTYDQVLGDLLPGDGDSSLTFFPRAISPNHHALAERFGTYDRFFVNAEVSAQGHPWSTAGYVTDYVEKTTPDSYRGRRPEPDEPGDVDDPVAGYLWDAAARKHLSLRNYGEASEVMPRAPDAADAKRDGSEHDVRAMLPSLQPYTNPSYPPFDMAVSDQRRADVWISEFHEYERAAKMPSLEILHLPRDHTAGLRAGLCTPRACFADNDLALGRIIEALSHSQFWSKTVVFVLEDDAQAGPDHVDSHRSVMFVISPWARGGVVHRFVNTTDVLATMEEMLGLAAFSHFDHFGRPLREIWRSSPDNRAYTALTPAQPLAELNLASAAGARASAHIDLAREDRVDDTVFNRILWRALKGTMPYPTRKRLALLEAARAR
ncbi:MAG: bifunctional YncE family protein/alkaline phosphatase family protein [Gemmatimonadaceae bacterium]|nr:bifunctional YncE family protein/alkaline phosphatase family protein [Gemmatimonadaceae bacterium]